MTTTELPFIPETAAVGGYAEAITTAAVTVAMAETKSPSAKVGTAQPETFIVTTQTPATATFAETAAKEVTKVVTQSPHVAIAAKAAGSKVVGSTTRTPTKTEEAGQRTQTGGTKKAAPSTVPPLSPIATTAITVPSPEEDVAITVAADAVVEQKISSLVVFNVSAFAETAVSKEANRLDL